MYLLTFLVEDILGGHFVGGGGHFVVGLCGACLGRLGGGGRGGRLNDDRDDVIILDDVVVDVTGGSIRKYNMIC